MMVWYTVLMPYAQVLMGVYWLDKMSREGRVSWWRWIFCALACISFMGAISGIAEIKILVSELKA